MFIYVLRHYTSKQFHISGRKVTGLSLFCSFPFGLFFIINPVVIHSSTLILFILSFNCGTILLLFCYWNPVTVFIHNIRARHFPLCYLFHLDVKFRCCLTTIIVLPFDLLHSPILTLYLSFYRPLTVPTLNTAKKVNNFYLPRRIFFHHLREFLFVTLSCFSSFAKLILLSNVWLSIFRVLSLKLKSQIWSPYIHGSFIIKILPKLYDWYWYHTAFQFLFSTIVLIYTLV